MVIKDDTPDRPHTRNQVSASAGSARDLELVSKELSSSSTNDIPKEETPQSQLLTHDDTVTPKPSTSNEKDNASIKAVKIQVHKLQMDIHQLIQKDDETLYISAVQVPTRELLSEVPIPSPPHVDRPEDTVSNISDKTKIYWPIDVPENMGNKIETPKKPTCYFSIQTHGLKRCKPRYYFKCKMNGCAYTFHTLKGWNIYHRAHYKGVLLKCDKCSRRFNTPSAHCAHHNVHATIKFMCETCGHKFAFNSALQLHHNAHSKIRKYRCFSGGCKKSTYGPKISTDMWASTSIINSAVKNVTTLLTRKGY